MTPLFKGFDVDPRTGSYYWELHHNHTPFWVDFYATIKPTDKQCGQERFFNDFFINILLIKYKVKFLLISLAEIKKMLEVQSP